MPKRLKIIMKSEKLRIPGYLPSRIVLHKWKEIPQWGTEYATHIQVFPGVEEKGRKPYLISGNYIIGLKEAKKDFYRRAKKDCSYAGKTWDGKRNRCRV